MKPPMVTRDADTFVALGKAVQLAADEGALPREEAADLGEALVAGILTGCMELDTYARVHDALARLLDRAFEGPTRTVTGPATPPAGASAPEEPLGVYLEVVGDAWESVGWESESCLRLRAFCRAVFDPARGRFQHDGAWFHAPVLGSADDVHAAARAAGLLVVSIQGTPPPPPLVGRLSPLDAEPAGCRLVLGWGDRRSALDLASAH